MTSLLLDNFYSELSSDFSTSSAGQFSCFIRLNPEHPVYQGHFGDLPVAPGVCLIQIVKELLESKLGFNMVLSSGDNIKFLAMINPRETSDFEIRFQINKSNALTDVSAIYLSADKTYVKFKGKFTRGNPS